ncbi:1-phosphofructokinase family hexose kinase [Bradyrhizobium sp.]|uniref:1-phosphofructokinase family hexose kinase n=1 Tax=Bradyrhizobium sp. TaxID=376 RepID=UPI002B621952|nr:1-phosphofructokinase family hexose kinase [Bradyrhizobium sp.]HMM87790.1 1-phosphofructokinase family hexose kinase [Bradyrhizobium sp.]
MTDIATITPNPAIDLSTAVDRIVPVAKLRGRTQRRDPGGGGINVARVIRRLGGDARAIYPVGGAIGILLRQLLDSEGVTSHTWRIAAETRENFFVDEIGAGKQYRFILPGPRLGETEWQECLKLVAAIEPFPRFLVASGSLPDGVPDDFYARVARIAKPRGAKLILDTSGPALAAATAEGVDLIKPNLREMRELSGSEPSDAYEWETAARELVERKKAAVVALTMGHLGAALVTREAILRAPPIPITPRSAVGAGDSFLGALVWRLAGGAAIADAFRLAVAAGAAALIHPGTELCRPDEVARLADQVTIETV